MILPSEWSSKPVIFLEALRFCEPESNSSKRSSVSSGLAVLM